MGFIILMFFGVLGFLVYLITKLYNELSRLNSRVNRNFSGIDTQLSRRHAVIRNLLGSVGREQKGVMEQFDALTNLVNKADGQRDNQELYLDTEKQISQTLNQLLVLPQVQTIHGFQDLNRQIADIEEELAAARRTYNDSVEKFNTYLISFPWGLIAQLIFKRFKERPYFEASADEKKNIDV